MLLPNCSISITGLMPVAIDVNAKLRTAKLICPNTAATPDIHMIRNASITTGVNAAGLAIIQNNEMSVTNTLKKILITQSPIKF